MAGMPGEVTPIFELLFLGLGLALVVWRIEAAIRVERDARLRGWSRLAGLGWAVTALAYPAGYWWQARLERLSASEADHLLQSAAQAHRLASVANVRCPLCDAEIVNALAVTASGALAIRPLAHCPRCDFRLDACRHCQHFIPAEDGIGGQKDITYGRCRLYRASQPVREAFPNVAKRLEAMGYDTMNAPKRIVDSYVPLDECTGFALDEARIKVSRIRWLNRQRAALIRLRSNQPAVGR
jgi:hypothetical protein